MYSAGIEPETPWVWAWIWAGNSPTLNTPTGRRRKKDIVAVIVVVPVLLPLCLERESGVILSLVLSVGKAHWLSYPKLLYILYFFHGLVCRAEHEAFRV